jgi:hypothetical protein
LRAVSTAAVPITPELNAAAPDDHFIAGPHCGVISSDGRRVGHASCYPTVNGGSISTASIGLTKVSTSTPDDHLITSPYCRMTGSPIGCIESVSSGPNVRNWIVFATRIQRPVAIAAPYNHFTTGPYCCVRESGSRYIIGASRRPSVRTWIVFATGMRSSEFVISSPNYHFVATPYRRVIDSCGWRIARVDARPNTCSRIISSSSI